MYQYHLRLALLNRIKCLLHLQHHTQPHVQFHQHRHVQLHHHHREQVQFHQIFQHLQDQFTHVPEHQHRHIHQNVLNNQIIHHRDTHVQVLMLIFHHHLLRCDLQEVKDPIQRIEDNHCRDNGKKKYLKLFFQILIWFFMKMPAWKNMSTSFLDLVLGRRFLGSRSRGFAVKIFLIFFLKMFSEFLEVLFQFLIEFFPTFFVNL